MTISSVWSLLEKWADWAAVRAQEAATKANPITFTFKSSLKKHFCEVEVLFPDCGFPGATSFLASEMPSLLSQTLHLNFSAGSNTRIYLHSKGMVWSIDAEATLDLSNGTINLEEVNEGRGLEKIGAITITMPLPCNLKKFKEEGRGFVRHCGILQNELETQFKIELQFENGTANCDIPTQFLAGHSEITDHIFTLRCGAYFQTPFEEESRIVLLNCVPGAKFRFLRQIIRQCRPRTSWKSVVREHNLEIAPVNPKIFSKNILLVFQVKKIHPFTNGLGEEGEEDDEGEEEWLVPLSKMEYCMYNAARKLLEGCLCELIFDGFEEDVLYSFVDSLMITQTTASLA